MPTTKSYDIRGQYGFVATTGLVTVVDAGTASAGHIFTMRWSSTTATKMFLKYVGARFIATTAYGTAQETGCDLILARSYSANSSGGTAVDVGSTVANTGNLKSEYPTSLVIAGATRIATTAGFTAGTHTLDANPIGLVNGWTSAIGIAIPEATSGAGGGFAELWNSEKSTHKAPIMFTTDEGFVIRNTILMGATGVGRWTFKVEWDEGTPHA